MPRLFDGVDDDIDFGSDASIDEIFAASPFTGTIAFWFQRVATGFHGILSKGDDSTTGWSLFFRGAGASHTMAFHRRSSTANSGKWQTTTQFSGTGVWRHAVCQYDGALTTNDAAIYIDGVTETMNEFVAPTAAVGSDAALTMFAGDHFDAGAPASIILSNITVSKTLWTDAQRRNHMNHAQPGGTHLIVHPLLSDDVTNHGTGTANATVTGATMVGFHRVSRPGCVGIW